MTGKVIYVPSRQIPICFLPIFTSDPDSMFDQLEQINEDDLIVEEIQTDQ